MNDLTTQPTHARTTAGRGSPPLPSDAPWPPAAPLSWSSLCRRRWDERLTDATREAAAEQAPSATRPARLARSGANVVRTA